MSALSPNNARGIARLITVGMGYCCEWKFFSLYHDCEVIAARLGVTARAVRTHKAAFLAGEMQCQNCPDCMKSKLPKQKK